MSVKLRLARGGAKKRPFYRLVATASRSPRDGDFLEKLGTYDPQQPEGDDRRLVLKQERIAYWLSVGAQPSERVAKFLRKAGILKTPAPKYTVFKKSKKEAKAEASA